MKVIFKKSKLFIFLLILLSLQNEGFAQFVSINSSNIFVVGNCPIYFNGANTPWESWNDFGGTYNSAKWTQNMVDLKNNGINSARIWFSCNGGGQPSINGSGVTTGVSAAFWSNCDNLFAAAQANGIYIQATMMSFDHTKNGNPNATNWQNMLNSQANVQTFVNTYVIPFVNRYKTNPYLWSIDACNEIEWIYENRVGNGDGSQWAGATYAILQRYVAILADGVHNNPRTDGSTVLVSVGSASVKWNGTKLPNGSTNPDGNKWDDASLKAQYNQPKAILDFYSPHYYGWMNSNYSSPFQRTPTQYGMNDKACVVAEMPSRDPLPTPAMTLTTAYTNLKTGGWQGHLPWTANITTGLTAEIGDLADFGAAALAFKTANPTLVVPPASCSLPISFLEIGAKKEGNSTALLWAITAEGVEYGNFTIYGSKDGVSFNKLDDLPFVSGQLYYSFTLSEVRDDYFYVECISNKSTVDRSKMVHASSDNDSEKFYKVYYTREEEPVLNLFSTTTVIINLISADGRIVHLGEYKEASSIELKNYITKEGLYILQLNSSEKYYQEKIIVR